MTRRPLTRANLQLALAIEESSAQQAGAPRQSQTDRCLTTGMPLAGSGVDPKLLSTSMRKDGQLEVDYKGHPLYYFIADKKPGDLTGQGLNNFGGSWYVVSPAGDKIDKS